jgi:hypothetical protein
LRSNRRGITKKTKSIVKGLEKSIDGWYEVTKNKNGLNTGKNPKWNYVSVLDMHVLDMHVLDRHGKHLRFRYFLNPQDKVRFHRAFYIVHKLVVWCVW